MTNDPEKGQYVLVDAPWPDNPRYELPTPRFGPGARIRFRWGDGYLQGTIIQVRAYFDVSPGKVTYNVREIGHRRDVVDDGMADIVAI